MNRAQANAIAKDVAAALDAIAKKHGLTYTRGGGKFDDSMFRISNIQFDVPASSDVPLGKKPKGVATAKQIDCYNWYRNTLHKDLPEIGAVIVDRRATLRVTGWNTKAKKNPIMLVDVDNGTSWHGPAAWVIKLAKAQVK